MPSPNLVKTNTVLGLTGGIGSGKSTVAKLFATLNIPIIDLDQISRQVVAPGTAGLNAILKAFGETIFEQGQLNRNKLKERIFTNPQDKKILESILHPLILNMVDQQLLALSDQPIVLVEIPLLAELGKPDYIDKVIVCDCSIETQISRVQQRDNLDRKLIDAILRQQASREQRLAIADYVLNTAQTTSALRNDILCLLQKIGKKDALPNYSYPAKP